MLSAVSDADGSLRAVALLGSAVDADCPAVIACQCFDRSVERRPDGSEDVSTSSDERSVHDCRVQTSVGSLRHAFPHDLTDGFDFVVVDAQNGIQDLRGIQTNEGRSLRTF